MKIGISGLPQSGKKTLFFALTGLDPVKNRVGISKVKDLRIDFLTNLYKPKKTVLPEIEYTLVPDIVNTEAEKDIAFKTLLNLDSFIFLARAFEDDSIYHVDGTVDPLRDTRNFISDLLLRDLMLIEKRIDALNLNIRKKPTDEKKKELALIKKIKEHLENENFIGTMKFNNEEESILSAYQFLTDKKLMVIMNFPEGQDSKSRIDDMEKTISNPNTTFLGVSAKVEMEIAGLDDDQMKNDFLREMGLAEPASDKITRFSYDSLNLISFFTVGADEVRAWTVKRDSSILKAARKIHQDMEKGFIRAEIIKYAALKEHGSEQKVKEKGLFQLKGKDYTVEDGDIISFRFNV